MWRVYDADGVLLAGVVVEDGSGVGPSPCRHLYGFCGFVSEGGLGAAVAGATLNYPLASPLTRRAQRIPRSRRLAAA